MRSFIRLAFWLAFWVCVLTGSAYSGPTSSAAASTHALAPRIAVRFDPRLGELHGRLLVFLTRSRIRHGEPVDADYLHPRTVQIVATEIETLAAGSSVEIPLDAAAYPAAVRNIGPGRYVARAELDVQHRYSYDGSQPGDPESGNVTVHLVSGALTTIGVDRRAPAPPPRARTSVGGQEVSFVSPLLSEFAGRRIVMRAYVAPPAGYASSNRRYATVYVVGGYGASRRSLPRMAAAYLKGARAGGGGKDLIYVVLDAHVPLGHSVFADSVNNGPWGRALTTEFIPYLESHWRMTGTEQTRFLTGHSSGGWATMWLQTTYPSVFGGTWSTSPDPLDFHDFTGPDLVDSPRGTFYTDPRGKPYMLVRVRGKDVVALREYVLQEAALGSYGGQFGSFDAVFSPRGADGRPQPLFDRTTGRIDPSVARAWEARYDIVHNLKRDWPRIGPKLRGKIHVIAGGWDTFHLDRGVIRLRTALASLAGSDATIEIVPRRDHFNLYRGSHGGLLARFDREMRAAAARAAARAYSGAGSRASMKSLTIGTRTSSPFQALRP